MKILITGANGQLGSELINILKSGKCALGEIPDILKNCEIAAFDVLELDITNTENVINTIKTEKPEIVINCAAYTNVDGAQDDCQTALNVNSNGVENLVKGCKTVNAKFVHISTDYVFDGKATTPYTESDEINPVSVYGKTKALGEKAAAEYDKAFIVRTAWLYGKTGKNFVKTILKLSSERENISVVNDQQGTPTNAEDLSFNILNLCVSENFGLYHCTGEGCCTWYDFACEIVALSKNNCKVNPCTTAEFKTKAQRPEYSVLENKALKDAQINFMRPWKTSLKDFIKEMP